MIFKNKNAIVLNSPPFVLNYENIPVVDENCYFGHIIDKHLNGSCFIIHSV